MNNKEPYRSLRIVFMGTPEFAVASLHALVEAGCHIVGVITAPDKPAGRGMTMQQSAVKKYALEKELTILQPDKLRNAAFLQELKMLNADLQICVAFRMLPEVVWNMPPMGTINLHGSLLPQYRGAAPINWAVINGEKETGVTTFKLQHEIDTGNILMQQSFSINETDNAGTVHDTMKVVGAKLLLETVKGLANGKLEGMPQLLSTNETLHHAPKIFTETCEINFNKNIEEVYNLIRGLSPYPTAFTFIEGKKLKIFSAQKEENHEAQAFEKTYVSDGKNYLKFRCNNGFIYATDVQLEGKKRMLIGDFLRGYRFNNTI